MQAHIRITPLPQNKSSEIITRKGKISWSFYDLIYAENRTCGWPVYHFTSKTFIEITKDSRGCGRLVEELKDKSTRQDMGTKNEASWQDFHIPGIMLGNMSLFLAKCWETRVCASDNCARMAISSSQHYLYRMGVKYTKKYKQCLEPSRTHCTST